MTYVICLGSALPSALSIQAVNPQQVMFSYFTFLVSVSSRVKCISIYKRYLREQKECQFLPRTLLVFVCDFVGEIKLNMQMN